mmetsp:Transcript_14015/g.38831  ORF Transcript_14015/g.38831 Transcript_14015/m.38831 type:complete len:203 (-) Transcript_14015:2019-2627(-)
MPASLAGLLKSNPATVAPTPWAPPALHSASCRPNGCRRRYTTWGLPSLSRNSILKPRGSCGNRASSVSRSRSSVTGSSSATVLAPPPLPPLPPLGTTTSPARSNDHPTATPWAAARLSGVKALTCSPEPCRMNSSPTGRRSKQKLRTVSSGARKSSLKGHGAKLDDSWLSNLCSVSRQRKSETSFSFTWVSLQPTRTPRSLA